MRLHNGLHLACLLRCRYGLTVGLDGAAAVGEAAHEGVDEEDGADRQKGDKSEGGDAEWDGITRCHQPFMRAPAIAGAR